jgi:plastocyanin
MSTSAWALRIELAAVVLGGLLSSSAESTPAAGQAPASHTVVIDSLRFEPPELVVRVGETIEWINHDPFPHTVTARGGQFDSHEIAAGGTWKYTPKKAGDIAYGCTFHPTMSGTIRVQQASPSR